MAIWTLQLSAAGVLGLALLVACGASNDSGSSADDEPAAGAGGVNAAGSPASDGGSSPGVGGSNPSGGGIIQALHAALGNSAIALQSADTTAFWPEAATDENDEWLVTVLGAYDGDLGDGAATGHYLVTQPTGASLDFELEAATSAAPYRAFVGPSWLTIFLQQAGASGFRVDVTCSDAEVDATGAGVAVVLVGQDTGDTTNGSLFCVAAAGPSPEPFSQPATSFEIEADADGYAVMPYFEVTVATATSAEGDTASAKAKVHMEFTALN